VGKARPAGPCATYPGDDTWTDISFTDGVVLIGDAAGHNDPIIGQGAVNRSSRRGNVRDVLLSAGHHSPDFSGYGEERSSRMERLRFCADVMSVAQAEDADNRSARRAFFAEKLESMDPEPFPLLTGAFVGPETIPQELVQPALRDCIRSAP
jgi:hypothetical protein